MSAIGPERTCTAALHMSAFGHKADISFLGPAPFRAPEYRRKANARKLREETRSPGDSDRYLEFLGGAEGYLFAGLNLNWLSGRRMAADAGSAITHHQNSEPGDLHGGSVQARYDTVYAQCMTAKGNRVAAPAVVAEPVYVYPRPYYWGPRPYYYGYYSYGW